MEEGLISVIIIEAFGMVVAFFFGKWVQRTNTIARAREASHRRTQSTLLVMRQNALAAAVIQNPIDIAAVNQLYSSNRHGGTVNSTSNDGENHD